ncbi:MAG: hypothetical protein MJH11_21140 [Lentisphaeria bacterium]|nr:hypothetical protein [Lentisphaeria bacterium]
MRRTLTTVWLSGLLSLGIVSTLSAHESAVDRVSRNLRLWIEGDHLRIRYEEQISERSALLELHVMDRNRDGSVQDKERVSYLLAKAKLAASRLRIQIDGKPLVLTPMGPVDLRRNWRQVYHFQAPLADVLAGDHVFQLTDHNSQMRPGPFLWTLGPSKAVEAKMKGPRIASLRGPRTGKAEQNSALGSIRLNLVLKVAARKKK